MTEENPNNIANLERENTGDQAKVLAAMALQRSGLKNIDVGTIDYLTSEFEPLQKMHALLNEYGDSINKIRDHWETDMNLRVGAYEELVQKIGPQYEEAVKDLQHAVKVRRQELQRLVFGPPPSTVATKGSVQLNYRDALLRLQHASTEELEQAADLAGTRPGQRQATKGAVCTRLTR